LKEGAGKDISVMLTPLSEEAFARFVESNDYNVEQVIVLQEALMK
jgi:hypothetical protein